MKTLFFIFTLSFSTFLYAKGFDASLEKPQFLEDSYRNKEVPCSNFDVFYEVLPYQNFYSSLGIHSFNDLKVTYFGQSIDTCLALGWYDGLISFLSFKGEAHTIFNYYAWKVVEEDILFNFPTCANGSTPYLTFRHYGQFSEELHQICHGDISSIDCNIFPEECFCPDKNPAHEVFYLVVCKLSSPESSPSESSPGFDIAEKTLKTTNGLISESNSKLGAIANAKGQNFELLKNISNSLKKVSSYFLGSSANTSKDSNTGNTIDTTVNTFSTSVLDVSTISSNMSADGSCPSPKNFSVLNSSFSFSYQPICDFANRVRPIVIAAARVTAAAIVLGVI